MSKTKLPPFNVLANHSKPGNAELRILALDPGETVGWCYWCGDKVLETGQVRTTEFTADQIDDLCDLFKDRPIDAVVYESYRVYAWKTEDHAWNEVHTAQVIGIIRMMCLRLDLPYNMQTAQVAKQFMTDEKMTVWGYWVRGMKHARDAIRHAAWFRMFGGLDKCWGRKGKPDI